MIAFGFVSTPDKVSFFTWLLKIGEKPLKIFRVRVVNDYADTVGLNSSGTRGEAKRRTHEAANSLCLKGDIFETELVFKPNH